MDSKVLAPTRTCGNVIIFVARVVVVVVAALRENKIKLLINSRFPSHFRTNCI